MPRKLFKKYLPDRKIVLENKYLQVFGRLIHDTNLWHLNRRSASRGVAIGFFSAFIPLPFQMILSAALAITLRANILIAVVLVWISNPLTMPPIFYFAYKVGALIMQIPPQPLNFQFSWSWFTAKIGIIWAPLLLGGFICGIIAAFIGYTVVRIAWRINVLLHLDRKRKRAQQKKLHQNNNKNQPNS